MLELVAQSATALWLGVLAAISPCPLATNIAAVSYIGGGTRTRRVLATSLMYALGRMAAYVGLAALLVYGALAAPVTSHVLQKWMIRVIGPLMLATAVFLTGWIRLPWSGLQVGERVQQRAARAGAAGALLLGFLFALTFCPVSAGLFFGALLPVAIESRSAVLLPSAFGVGTALPVLAIGAAVAGGAQQVARVFDRTTACEKWARLVTAGLFAVIGSWFTLRYTLGVWS